jgi:hypothetical protein
VLEKDPNHSLINVEKVPRDVLNSGKKLPIIYVEKW